MSPARAAAAIDYAAVDPAARRRPSATVALALCVPGALCWLELFLVVVQQLTSTRVIVGAASSLYRLVDVRIALCGWVLAIVTALVSFAIYRRRRPKPWFVWLNLVVNGCGLLFTAGVMLLIALFGLLH